MTSMITPKPDLSPVAQRMRREFEARARVDRRIAVCNGILFFCAGMLLMALAVAAISYWGL